MGFNVADLRRQQDALLREIARATDKAAQRLGARSEQIAKVTSPGKTYQMRAGWYYRCWRSGGTVTGELGNKVQHALYVEEGTGLYGPRRAKYPIVPRRKKMLSWVGSDGKRVFARRVMHPGIKPRFIGYAALFAQRPPYVGSDTSRNVALIESELRKVT